MLFSFLYLISTVATLVVAAPFETPTFAGWSQPHPNGPSCGNNIWSAPLAPGQPILNPSPGSCNLANAVNNMQAAPTPLSPPTAGLTVALVAIGRGTQNYTCDAANPSAAPVAVGALAALFNVSCMAADSPALMHMLPAIALEQPLPSMTQESGPGYEDLAGHHFFAGPGIPFFDMNTTSHDYGSGAFKKGEASAAPFGALAGQNGLGYGAVDWLRLNPHSDAQQTYKQVYRLNTVGGAAPPTCEGQPAEFEVQYAAEYWLFS